MFSALANQLEAGVDFTIVDYTTWLRYQRRRIMKGMEEQRKKLGAMTPDQEEEIELQARAFIAAVVAGQKLME
jgi:hypothetical protein